MQLKMLQLESSSCDEIISQTLPLIFVLIVRSQKLLHIFYCPAINSEQQSLIHLLICLANKNGEKFAPPKITQCQWQKTKKQKNSVHFFFCCLHCHLLMIPIAPVSGQADQSKANYLAQSESRYGNLRRALVSLPSCCRCTKFLSEIGATSTSLLTFSL